MTFREKAIRAIHKIATGSKSIRIPLTLIGALFFLLLTALFVVLSLQADSMLGFPSLLPFSWNIYISIPLLLAGVFLCLWTAVLFLKARGTPVPLNPPDKLITTGPYAYCRNPMLTGVFMLLFGLAIQFRSVSLFIIFTPLYILLHVMELKTFEEPELARRLGEEYLEYKKRTPMFIPCLRVKSGIK